MKADLICRPIRPPGGASDGSGVRRAVPEHEELIRSRGIEIDVAYTPPGEVDYVYEVGRLLAANTVDRFDQLRQILPGLHPVDPDAELGSGGLVLLAIDGVGTGNLTVPQVLDLLDERPGDDNPALDGHDPLATPAAAAVPLVVAHVAAGAELAGG